MKVQGGGEMKPSQPPSPYIRPFPDTYIHTTYFTNRLLVWYLH